MKLIPIVTVLGIVLTMAWALGQETKPMEIDWGKATLLHERSQNGQKLTADEQAYLDRAQAALNAGRGSGHASTQPVPPAHEKLGLLPLNQMTQKDVYKEQDGGLYGQGKNDPPVEQLKAAKAALAKVRPLDKEGQPAADGKIVLMSVGMSNTAGEFTRFKALADASPEKNAGVVVVNGAIGGMTADFWDGPERQVWLIVADRLAKEQVTAKQVQVIWLKQALANPARWGDFPKHAQRLKGYLVTDIQQVLEHYPKVRVIYLSSRIYGGNATTSLNPEPYAYEGAFAARWVIQDQIKGAPELNFDPAKGPVKAPVLLWGPYLWADGTTPRKSDGLTYVPGDFAADGTHPSPNGQDKVAKMLQEFLKGELNAGWYVHGGTGLKQ